MQNRLSSVLRSNELIIAYIGFTFTMLVLAPTYLNYLSLFEKSIVAELILCFILIFRKTQRTFIYIPFPLLLVVLAIGISLIGHLQVPVIKDFSAFILIATIAIQLASVAKLEILAMGVSLSGLLAIFYTVLAVVMHPEISWGPEGQLQGPYGHWNSLAMTLVFSVPASLSLLNQKPIRFRIPVFITLIATVSGIILTRSVTALLVTIGIFICWAFLSAYKKFNKIAYILLGVFGFLLLFIPLNPSFFLRIVGKSEQLTGRVPIWNSIIHHSFENWFSGFGWTTIFPIDSTILNYVLIDTGVPARHAHNDLLNWFALTGIIGLIAVISCYLLLIVGGFLVLVRAPNSEEIWLPLTGICLAIEGLTEVSTATPQGWFLLTLGLATLGYFNLGKFSKLYLALRPICK